MLDVVTVKESDLEAKKPRLQKQPVNHLIRTRSPRLSSANRLGKVREDLGRKTKKCEALMTKVYGLWKRLEILSNALNDT